MDAAARPEVLLHGSLVQQLWHQVVPRHRGVDLVLDLARSHDLDLLLQSGDSAPSRRLTEPNRTFRGVAVVGTRVHAQRAQGKKVLVAAVHGGQLGAIQACAMVAVMLASRRFL